jgi:DNA-binding NtrC family response regulator
MHRILVIDDEQSIRELLKDFLQTKDFEVITSSDGETGIQLLKQDKFDLFLMDLMMPGISGLDVLRACRSENIDVPCIVITAHASVQTAVEAMKLGAYDYLPKPFVLEDVNMTIHRALDVYSLKEENRSLKSELKKQNTFNKRALDRIIGTSASIQSVIKFVEKIADTDSTVLITGESGTGKELIAKNIHYNSNRAGKPFVPLNCAAIPKDILESELFGHEKGAFTGAVSTRIGRFELANQGTLLLDEIGELAPALQVKLLRVLQEKEFERVGSIKTIKTDARIIAATNRDLEKAVKDGDFREDLYYRLNVIPLKLPPLRNMKEDIPLMIDHFITHMSKRKGMSVPTITKETMKCLTSYHWPGNVRELENLIERLIILNDGSVVEPVDLPERMRSKVRAGSVSGKEKLSPDGVDLNIMLEEIENNMIIQALEISRGVKSKAASLLGLNRTTLIEKMKKKAIEFNAS